ncbi:hypothetical protein [Actinomadura opuntiae]|uniref:hypothetical protein n=1 Tax=Actinomadura sp. OS1-43 TaxID=604315 RepID=UPI00255AD831|nr:hypothetical protein [Actinomadura sp. OS1-43]MDL4821173.1 hypothetical protein [Actinomadura sp. OS1-43]
MKGQASWAHGQVHQRVHSVMTAAMRADARTIDTALLQLGDGGLDPYSREFVREARRLVLACTAALTCVLSAHRPGAGPGGDEICRGCGTSGCRTLHGVADVLAAYAVRPVTIDRAEAWRRADAWFNRDGDPAPVAIAEFADGFAAWRVPDETAQVIVIVIDRERGTLTLWPPLPLDTLAREYRTYRRADQQTR